ncbi:hypothetical protein PVNG_04713 [Plasmodium vivax North Korean]|uniref:Variable surface protein n=1 Tax=Plasmodium vivax North Korean TaxID=1035514 RepID=A0A0J9U155_PLAVI|nr:hypothetical protein PVNG_04713 [Plasmodium vivax North Korean]
MAKKPPKYFTYHEYDELKKSFVYVPRDTIDVSFANYLISRITNTHEKELLLHDTFYQLKKLVERHHSFVEYGIEYCCYYINYWLNKTVRDSKYGINEHNFKYFDEFMKIDPNIRDNSINCISKLRYIDADTFQKMEKLYDLYDYFTKLKESEVPTTLCHNISDLAKSTIIRIIRNRRNRRNRQILRTNGTIQNIRTRTRTRIRIRATTRTRTTH